MINPATFIKKQRGGFLYRVNFAANSILTYTFVAQEDAVINVFNSSGAVTWTIQNAALTTLTSNTNPSVFNVVKGNLLIVSITKSSSSDLAFLEFGTRSPQFDYRVVNLRDYTDIGGDSRYTYVLRDNTHLVCIDNNLLSTANLKPVISVTNNGTSLTIEVTGHGFSNGDSISLVDVGGFTADVNHKPLTLSNVTTNTFDVTLTVTGTWDSAGWLAAAWISNPVISTISLPNTPNVIWYSLMYRSIDKSIYVFGDQNISPATRVSCVCVVSTDDADPDFNVVKDWPKTTTNSYTNFGSANSFPSQSRSIYDATNDLCFNGGNSAIFYFEFGGASPTALQASLLQTPNADPIFSYDSGDVIFADGTTYRFSHSPTVNGAQKIAGIQVNRPVYSKKYGRLYGKSNGASMHISLADKTFTTVAVVTGLVTTTLACGCSVDRLDKAYFFRISGSVSYPGTYDLTIWDTNLNTAGSREDTHILTWSSGASIINKAVYSHDSECVLAADNGASGRIHIFNTNRATGKKYIGYVLVGGSMKDLLMNNLAWL